MFTVRVKVTFVKRVVSSISLISKDIVRDSDYVGLQGTGLLLNSNLREDKAATYIKVGPLHYFDAQAVILPVKPLVSKINGQRAQALEVRSEKGLVHLGFFLAFMDY